MVGDALLDIIFSPDENDGVGMLIGKSLMSALLSKCGQAVLCPVVLICLMAGTDKCSRQTSRHALITSQVILQTLASLGQSEYEMHLETCSKRIWMISMLV